MSKSKAVCASIVAVIGVLLLLYAAAGSDASDERAPRRTARPSQFTLPTGTAEQVLIGRVLDPSGLPMGRVRVQVRRGDEVRSVRTYTIAAETTTDVDGRFRTPALAPAMLFELQASACTEGERVEIFRRVRGSGPALRDVGELRPLPTVHTFAVTGKPSHVAWAALSFVVTAHAENAESTWGIGPVPLGDDGRLTVIGLPDRKFSYSLVRDDTQAYGRVGYGEVRDPGRTVTIAYEAR